MKHKYYRVSANSMTSYELFIKVPESITEEDIWNQKGEEILCGSRFTEVYEGFGSGGDWEYDDVHEIDINDSCWKNKKFDEWVDVLPATCNCFLKSFFPIL